MGLLSKIVAQKDTEPKNQVTNELIKEELDLLLRILANADLKGRDVEFFYTMVLKLQNQYLSKQQQSQ